MRNILRTHNFSWLALEGFVGFSVKISITKYQRPKLSFAGTTPSKGSTEVLSSN